MSASNFSVEEIKMELDPSVQDLYYIGDEENDDQNGSFADHRLQVEAIPKNLVGFFEYSGTSLARGSQGPNKILKCLTCNHTRTSSGSSTGNFVTHLKTHPNVYRRYLQARQRRQEEAGTLRSSARPQPNLERIFKPKKSVDLSETPSTRSERITELLIRSIVTDVLPSCIVNSPTFRDLLRELDERYEPPSCEALTRTLRNRVEQHRLTMADVLRNVSSYTVLHLSCDIWTIWDTQIQKNMMAVRVHYIDSEWKLHRTALSMNHFSLKELESAELLLRRLLRELTLTTYNIRTCTVDNANQLLKAFTNLVPHRIREESTGIESTHERCGGNVNDDDVLELISCGSASRYPSPHGGSSEDLNLPAMRINSGIEQLPCVVHLLQSVLRDALENSSQMEALEQIQKVVIFFERSARHAELLYALSKQPLVYPVPLRWNSNYYMLQRFIKMYAHVCTILSEARMEQGIEVPKVQLREKSYYVELLSILDVFVEGTNSLQGDGVTASLVLPTIIGLSNFLLERKQDCKAEEHFQLIAKLQQALNEKFKDLVTEKSWTLATVLDPRFKLDLFKSTEKTRVSHSELITLPSSFMAESVLRQEYEKLSPVPVSVQMHNRPRPSTSLIYSVMQKGRQQVDDIQHPEELQSYLADSIDSYVHVTPLQFWEKNCTIFPTLSKLAQRYLSIPAITSDVERLFPAAGALIQARRAGLTSANMNDALTLREIMK